MRRSSARVVELLGLLSVIAAGEDSCMGRAMRHIPSLPMSMHLGRWHTLAFVGACRHPVFQDDMQRKYTKSAGCVGSGSKTSNEQVRRHS